MIPGSEKPGKTADLLQILQPGIRAVRRNWAPFLLIQIIAVLLVICYYNFEVVRAAARIVSHAKHHWGELFVIVSGGLAGGILPQAAKAVTGHAKRIDRQYLLDSLFVAFVFALVAVEVDALYRFQALLFGSGIGIATLIKKTAFDMFVFTPVVAVPTGMFLFFARRNGFRPGTLAAALNWQFFRAYVIPTLPLNWAFWIPMVMCVYALPQDLQFPFAQLAEGAWSLLFVFIAEEASSLL